MSIFNWNEEKNILLKGTRNISFERIVFAILQNKIVDVYNHPNNEKYPNQLIYEVEIENYIYLVPFVKNDNEIFLKTIIPSRKATKKYKKMKTKYNPEELEILEKYQNNQLVKSKTKDFDIRQAVLAAQNTITQNTEIKVNLSEKDIKNLKIKELETGIPFDKIISALIRSYLKNDLVVNI